MMDAPYRKVVFLSLYDRLGQDMFVDIQMVIELAIIELEKVEAG
jgi:hypothetical protein